MFLTFEASMLIAFLENFWDLFQKFISEFFLANFKLFKNQKFLSFL